MVKTLNMASTKGQREKERKKKKRYSDRGCRGIDTVATMHINYIYEGAFGIIGAEKP
jgi:hypothetical protein